MIREKSCGAVVFTVRNGARVYLVEHMVKGHTSICKGHVEGEETEHETAAREIWEETALKVRFIDGFRRTVEYSPYKGCMKEVVFFLAESGGTDTVSQPEEVVSCEWLPLGDALAALTHQSDRETVLAADRFLDTRSVPDFRPMRRKDRLMSGERCREILRNASSGVLAVLGDAGFPYAVPLSFVCDGDAVVFHCAGAGHKLDAVRREERCSFCVVDRDQVDPARYTTRYRSVIVFGRVREITDAAEKRRLITALAQKYSPADTAERRETFIDRELAETVILRLAIEHMTGKENG